MKTKTNHGAEITLQGRGRHCDIYIFCDCPKAFVDFRKLSRLPRAGYWIHWITSTSLFKLLGLRDYTLHVVPGQVLPDAARLFVLASGGVIATQEFTTEGK